MPKISIIIPVYNAEQYLRRCLDNACRQTLQDIEIICINDASTDNSLQILDEYAEKDNRLVIINLKTNHGESYARNKGLEIATGEYLGFVDNDDEIDLDFYEKLYKKAKETNADIVKGEVHVIDYYGEERYESLNEKIRNNNSKFYFTHNWWTAIYKRSMIMDNNINFPVGIMLGGDLLFLNQAILTANKVATIDDTFYHYYRRENSGDSKSLTLEKIKSALYIYEKIIDNINMAYETSVDNNGYDNIFNFIAVAIIHISFRSFQQKSKRACAETFIRLYRKCERRLALDAKLLIEYSCLLHYLQMSDVDGLTIFLSNHNTNVKLRVANLRQRTLPSQNKMSLIIPIYNVEQYLSKCLDNAINQTLKEIEIICVNDASLDASLEILRKYASNDNRIKIIDLKKNQGVSIARNTAIEQSKGDYIGFLDPDDYVDLNFYEKLYNKAFETEAEIAIGNAKRIENNLTLFDYNIFISRIKNNKMYFNGMFSLAIYKKSLLLQNKIQFPVGYTYGEDRLLPLMASFYTNKIEVIDDVYYYYLQREGSASYNFQKGQKQIKSFIDTTQLTLDFMNSITINSNDYKIVVKDYVEQIIDIFSKSKETERKLIIKFFLQFYEALKYKELSVDLIEKIHCCIKNNDFQNVLRILKTYDNKNKFFELRQKHLIGIKNGV